MARAVLAAVLLAACAGPDGPANTRGWWEEAEQYDVQESVAFTDVPYDFTGPDPIAQLPTAPDLGTVFGPDDLPPDCAAWSTDDTLPMVIEGIVTLHPRYYYKSFGCLPDPNDDDIDADEKYYGSYFIEDASGGVFVLGDSKVAHFDMGDRVRMRVRAIRDSYGVVTVAAHDILEVMRGPEPIYYEEQAEPLGDADVGAVHRVEGVVQTEMGNFGDFILGTDDGRNIGVSIDAELARRGAYWPPGTRLRVTGPVFFSFSAYEVLVMKLGQVEELPSTAD